MRLHLYAQRLEDLYAAFEKSFGLAPADFPDPDERKPSEGPKLGVGPYLGMSAVHRASSRDVEPAASGSATPTARSGLGTFPLPGDRCSSA
jgi:hypothetical protein